MNISTERLVAFEAINGERDYQDALGTNRRSQPASKPTVSAEILMLEEYVARARDAWVNQPGDIPSLIEIRKVAAIAIRAMENHGSLTRIQPVLS